MKNIIKKVTAAAFCGALLLSTAACADTSWCVKNDDETLSVGTYIYYMSQAYSEAKEKSKKSGNEVLSATIEDKTGEQWIKDRAKELCVEQLTLDKLCKDNKVAATNAEIDEYYNDTSVFYGMYSYAQMWGASKTSYESMGISEDSFKHAVIGTELNKSNLFDNIYGEGGSQEVKDSDLEKYFTENYIYYKSFSTSFTSTDDDGNSTEMTDTEKEAVKVRYQNYVKMINDQNKTMDDVVAQYKDDYDTDTDPSTESLDNINRDSYLGEDVLEKLKEIDEGEAAYVATDSGYYFLYKLPITDKVSTLTADDETSTRSSVMHAYKDEDFDDYIDEQAKELKYEANDAAFSKYTPARVIPAEDNESSEEESSETSDKSTDVESTDSEAVSTEATNSESTASEASAESSVTSEANSATESSADNSSAESSDNASSAASEANSATESSAESSSASSAA